MRYYCIAPNGRKSYVPEWLYEKRKRSSQHEVGTEAPSAAEYPKQVTENGWYELSSGEKVRGEDNAIEAQSALDNG